MKREAYIREAAHLRYQRNVFSFLSLILAIGVSILSSFLFMKSERVVITPPFVEKTFWVDGKNISPSYLEQYGLFLGQLLLNKSPSSAQSVRSMLLKHAAPAFVGAFKQKLIDEEERLIKQNVSYTFFPQTVDVSVDTMQVSLRGERVSYVSSKEIARQHEQYILTFTYTGGRLLLSGITSKEEKK